MSVRVTWDEPEVRIHTSKLPATFTELEREAEQFYIALGGYADYSTARSVIAYVRHRYTNYEDESRGLWEGEPRQIRTRRTFDQTITDTLRLKYGGVLPKYRRPDND